MYSAPSDRDYAEYLSPSWREDEDPANIALEREPEQRPEVGPQECPF
jgi:hypothetical protein